MISTINLLVKKQPRPLTQKGFNIKRVQLQKKIKNGTNGRSVIRKLTIGINGIKEPRHDTWRYITGDIDGLGFGFFDH